LFSIAASMKKPIGIIFLGIFKIPIGFEKYNELGINRVKSREKRKLIHYFITHIISLI